MPIWNNLEKCETLLKVEFCLFKACRLADISFPTLSRKLLAAAAGGKYLSAKQESNFPEKIPQQALILTGAYNTKYNTK